MDRREHLRILGLALAGGGAGFFLSYSSPSAQTGGSGEIPGFPGFIQGGQNERSPHLFLGPRGEIFRITVRESDPSKGPGAVAVATAGPQDTWKTLVEIPRPEKGIAAVDPAMAIAPSGELAIAYQWRRDNPRNRQIRLARSDDGGKTWTQGESPVDGQDKGFEPQVAWGAGRSLVVIWSDQRRFNRVFDIYARRSPDGGMTWEPEQLLSRFPQQFQKDLYARPRLLGDGRGRFWVVWVGLRAGRSALYLNRSVDEGRTWTDPVSLSGDSRSVFAQSVHRSDERLLLVWQDARSSHDRLYSVTSSDGGVTWTSPERVDHLPADLPVNGSSPAVLVRSNREVLVSWQDRRNRREDIFLTRSADGGRTWPGEDQRMDMDEPGTAVSRFSKLAEAPDGRVALAWEDDRDGPEAVYLRIRSAGDKPEWGPEIRVTNPTVEHAARLPDILWGRDGLLYLSWEAWDFKLGPSRPIKRVEGRALKPAAG
jgi:hypothetical protein